MDPLLLVLSIIALIVVVFTGLLGHLIHLNREKFGKFFNTHMLIGSLSTILVIILVVLLLMG